MGTQELTPVESSNIAAIGYDDNNLKLTVRFTNGATYDYADVPVEVGQNFFEAESIGKYFFANIRARFTGVKRIEEDADETG